jgi:hypothetical protein
MNKLLAEALALLNGLFALLIILLGGLVGWATGANWADSVARSWGVTSGAGATNAALLGTALGVGAGFVAAVLINGPLALLVHMLQELKDIRARLADGKGPETVVRTRVEPRMPLGKG